MEFANPTNNFEECMSDELQYISFTLLVEMRQGDKAIHICPGVWIAGYCLIRYLDSRIMLTSFAFFLISYFLINMN